MSTNIPKFRFGLVSFRYPALGLLSGLITYQLVTEIVLATIVGVLVPLLVLFIVMQVRVIEFRKHINRFGVPIISDKLEDAYSTDLTGLVPFKNTSVACTISVNTHGLAFGRLGAYRKLAWAEITSIKKSYYLGQPVAELSIDNMALNGSLVVPWSKTLNDYLPHGIHQQSS
ncbi:hypothetical protein R50072_35370 [Simiduia litorea]